MLWKWSYDKQRRDELNVDGYNVCVIYLFWIFMPARLFNAKTKKLWKISNPRRNLFLWSFLSSDSFILIIRMICCYFGGLGEIVIMKRNKSGKIAEVAQILTLIAFLRENRLLWKKCIDGGFGWFWSIYAQLRAFIHTYMLHAYIQTGLYHMECIGECCWFVTPLIFFLVDKYSNSNTTSERE